MEQKLNFQEASQYLNGFANSLNLTVQDLIPQAKNILNGSDEHPMGAPSKESAAELILRGISEKIDEVMNMYNELLTSIGMPKHYKID